MSSVFIYNKSTTSNCNTTCNTHTNSNNKNNSFNNSIFKKISNNVQKLKLNNSKIKEQQKHPYMLLFSELINF